MFVTKATLLLVVAAVAAAARPTSLDQLKGYSFEQFVQDFKLQYSDSEINQRRDLFNAELARVIAHNSQNLGWKMGINKFTAMTEKEKKAFMGWSKGVARSHKPQHLKALPSDFSIRPLSELPEKVDWRDEGIVTAVKDQGHCGSCWAFSSTAVIESHVAKASGLLFDLSTEQLAMCAPNPDSCGGTGGCMGATYDVAFDYVSNSNGMMQEYQYPYTSYYGENYDCAVPAGEAPKASIDGYVKLPSNNYTALMNAVATVGPVAVTVDASVWHNYESGVFSGCDQKTPDINHGVVLVGYGTDEETGQAYWLIRNSWSPTFGEKGYIRIARTDAEEELCGLDITPEDGTACAGDDQPVRVCGTCGVLYDSAYPLNAAAF